MYFEFLPIFLYFLKLVYYFFLFWSGVCGLYMTYGLYFDNFTQEGRKKQKSQLLERQEELELHEKVRQLLPILLEKSEEEKTDIKKCKEN